jgi:hypothetical protein
MAFGADHPTTNDFVLNSNTKHLSKDINIDCAYGLSLGLTGRE